MLVSLFNDVVVGNNVINKGEYTMVFDAKTLTCLLVNRTGSTNYRFTQKQAENVYFRLTCHIRKERP